MTEPRQKTKKISRRDAIKLLGAAAGATVLANLPSKWSTPELASGVLPAHAQTSALHTLACDPSIGPSEDTNSIFASGVTISPPTPGILMQYTASTDIGILIAPSPATGTALTDGLGYASVLCERNVVLGTFTIVWQFANPQDGSGSCIQFAAFANSSP